MFYFDGNQTKISWAIQTQNSIVKENRTHVEIYRNKLANLQSKYVALHVGLFWGIGSFIIKEKDSMKIMLDEKVMQDHLMMTSKIEDDFIESKIGFIKQLIIQRGLKTEFEVISSDKNLSILNPA